MKLPWSSDNKTKVVDSLRKRETAEDDDRRKTVALNKSGDVSGEKTVPMRTDITNSEQARSKLSWPARDSGPAQRGSDRPHHDPGRSVPRDEETRLYTPHGSSAETEPASSADASRATPSPKTSDDPVVGWLVIIEGPGKGRSFELGFGANSIGRDKGQKVTLDFGDPHISREKHAMLVHDPKSMRFFLQTGDVRNLTYLGEEVVLNPVQLMGREIIMVGGTKLMFVPFCGPDFGWG
jgi:hypothetical protein